MITFLSIIIASIAVHLLNGWMEPFMDVSLRAMINLIIFIAVYMISGRYIKSLKG